MSGMRRWFLLLTACLLLCVFFLGCSRDDSPVDPAARGSIAVIVGPETQATPWRLVGPGGLVVEGVESRIMEGLADGEYTLTWQGLDGWVRPWPTSVSHRIDGGRAFVVEGEYRENVPSTVVVTTTPADAAATWTLRGSEGLMIQGTGDRILEDIDAGHYTVVFAHPEGWLNTGRQIIEDEVFGETLELSAEFVLDVVAPAGFEFIPGGTFTMGSSIEEWGHGIDELEHEVTLTNDIFMSSREVTRVQFKNLLVWAYTQDPPLVTVPTVFDTVFIRTVIDPEDACSGVVEIDGGDTVCVTIASIDTLYPVMDNLDVPDGSAPSLEIVVLANMGLAYDHVFSIISMTGAPNEPIIGLSWYAAAAYCDWLSLRNGMAQTYDHADWTCNGGDPYGAEGYRLPTEAEWERACRAGSVTALTNGPVINPVCDDPNLKLVGWRCAQGLSNVGSLGSNAWGLRDVHGNAWEWVQDWHADYVVGPVTDPVVLEQPFPGETSAVVGRPMFDPFEVIDFSEAKFLDPVRVIRGGDATKFSVVCRSANRSGFDPFWTSNKIGFRPVMTVSGIE